MDLRWLLLYVYFIAQRIVVYSLLDGVFLCATTIVVGALVLNDSPLTSKDASVISKTDRHMHMVQWGTSGCSTKISLQIPFLDLPYSPRFMIRHNMTVINRIQTRKSQAMHSCASTS